MSGGLAKLILDDLENGVNVHSYETVVTGPPKPRRDRTASAAPLGWQPPEEQEGTPT